MELTYFYKAEMPNCQDWTLDVSKLNIILKAKCPKLQPNLIKESVGL